MGIKRKLKSFLLNIVPPFLIREIENSILKQKSVNEQFINLSYSQEGEDLILARYFEGKNNGFFVDVGAHHPIRFSNTYKFYQLGWRGINIDPLPGSMKTFNELRTNDINLEIAVLNSEKDELDYYSFNEPALNTFNKDLAFSIEKQGRYKLVESIKLESFKLSTILENHVKEGQIIDFLTIDVEGMDFEVLKSNNWGKYRPEYIVLESLNSTIENDMKSEISVFLKDRSYLPVSKTVNSLIYKLMSDN